MKHQTWKRALSAFLAAIMIAVMIPISVAADTEGYYTYEVYDGKATITSVDTAISGDVVIPSTLGGYPVIGIDYYAFENCENITSVTVPEGVRYIEWYAFYYCTSLTQINLPASLTYTSYDAFDGCYALEAINVAEGSEEYISVDGVFFGDSGATLIKYPIAKADAVYTVPDEVEVIGDHAFEYCEALTAVTVPDGVEVISYSAFSLCENLADITLPDKNIEIDSDAFYGTAYYNDSANREDGSLYIGSHLIRANYETSGTFTVKDGTVTIADCAFGWHEGITSISLPDSLKRIGDDAFYECYGLTSITVPAGVENIGYSAFAYCEALSEITLPETGVEINSDAFYDTAYYNDPANWEDGVLYIGCHLVAANDDARSAYIVKDGTLTIAESAFSLINISGIIIPDSVEFIGESAFYNSYVIIYCNSGSYAESYAIENDISYAPIPDLGDPESLYIYEKYENGVEITEVNKFISGDVVIPSTLGGYPVLSIGYYAFNNCDEITSVTVPEGVTYIGQEAFYACNSLTDVTLPASLEYISTNTFEGCISLENITVAEENTEYKSVDGILFTKSDDTLMKYPADKTATEYTIPDGIRVIGDHAFEYCEALISVTIPDSVEKIGEYAFGSCEALTSVTIPDSVKEIGNYAFSWCYDLEEITLPEKSIKIGSDAFYDTAYYNDSDNWEDGSLYIGSHLIRINYDINSTFAVKDGTITIADCAFEGNDELTAITLPDSLKRIGKQAFSDCHYLTSITVPESVEEIGYYAFSWCYNLEEITLPEKIIDIDLDAFFDTAYYNDSANWEDGVLYIGCHLVSVKWGVSNNYTVKDGTLTIARSAFSWFDLSSIIIPDSVKFIGKDAFFNCYNIVIFCNKDSYAESYAIENGIDYSQLPDMSDPETIYTYNVSDGKAIIIDVSDFVFGDIVVPDTLGGYPVSGIDSYAFENCNMITGVTIPDSVTYIEYGAFYCCYNLESVTLSRSITFISNSAFRECYSLVEITIPASVTYIADDAFTWCDSLEAINVDSANTVYESIDGVMFTKGGDTLVKYPDGRTAAEYTVPEKVETVGNRAFFGARNLTKVAFSDSVTAIEDYAFSDCYMLKDIAIPKNLEHIGEGVFGCCYSLKDINVDADNAVYKSADGSLLSKDGTRFIQYPLGRTDESYTIPAGVKIIGSSAFSNSEVTSIVIPEGVTTIEHSAFHNSYNLSDINLPESIVKIGSDAFKYTRYYYNSDNWEDGVLYIGKHLINVEWDISGTCTVKDGTLTIADGAFNWCEYLTEITLPDSIMTIGDYAFMGCNSLAKITLPEKVISIGYDAFYGTAYHNDNANWENGVLYIGCHLVSVKWDVSNTYTVKDGTLTIADYTFSGWSLLGIIIPDSVKFIGEGAFYDCGELTIYCNEGSYAESYAIANDIDYKYISDMGGDDSNDDSQTEGIYTYKVSEGAATITDVDDSASGDVVIPSTLGGYPVTGIGEGAFAGCTGITGVTVPDSVVYIGKGAFYGCGELTIYCNEGSYAESYAVENDIPYKIIGDVSDSTPGDANGDGKVNLGDVSLILKHIAKWNIELDLDAADVTDDGKVNLADVSLILKHIAKWDVVLK